MSDTRRTFLKHVGAGLFGTAGIVIPETALAFGRRRRGMCYPVQVGPGPICQTPVGIEPVIPRTAAPVVDVCYPSPTGGTGISPSPPPTPVRGSGFFLAWGYAQSGVTVNGLILQDAFSGNPVGSTSPLAPTFLANGVNWAYIVKDVPVGTTFTMIFGLSAGGPFIWRYFKAVA
jgi:hypothetical protein